MLKQFCARENDARCEFESIKQHRINGGERKVGPFIKSFSSVRRQLGPLDRSERVTEFNSLGLQLVKHGDNRVYLAVAGPIERIARSRLIDSAVFRTALSISVGPHQEAWIGFAPPIDRYTGDFKLTLANTTWILRDVSFEFPDPLRSGVWTVRERPLPSP